MSRKQSFQIDHARPSRLQYPDKTANQQFFIKNHQINFDKQSIQTANTISQQRNFLSTAPNFSAIRRLPDSISSIRETFSYNPINIKKQETDFSIKSNKSKNERLKQLLNIALDLEKLQKKSPSGRDPISLSVQQKFDEDKYSKSQKQIEEKPSFLNDQTKFSKYGASEKQIKSYGQISKSYNYDKSHSVTVEQQIQKIRLENQKRKSENSKPIEKNQFTTHKAINNNESTKDSFSKKNYVQYFSPKLQKSMYSKNFQGINTLSPVYIKRKKQTSFEVKCQSPNKILSNQVRKLSFTQNKNHKKITLLVSQKVNIQDFQIGKMLGKGRFGIAYLAIHKTTGCLFAIKMIKKQTIKANKLIDQFILQVKLQSYFSHPFILKIYAIFDDSQNIYLVIEYLQQGCLFNYLKSCKSRKLTESDAAQKVKYLAEAVKYLQDRGIAHRDIKPQNIIMTHGVCKLADFGWATFCDQVRRKTYCGTCDYVAPEIIQGQQYDETVDLWCIGVLTYELVAGKAPFYHMSQKQTKNKIINANLNFPQDFSQNIKSFISGLVQKDPEQRMSIQQVLNHPFIKDVKLCD